MKKIGDTGRGRDLAVDMMDDDDGFLTSKLEICLNSQLRIVRKWCGMNVICTSYPNTLSPNVIHHLRLTLPMRNEQPKN